MSLVFHIVGSEWMCLCLYQCQVVFLVYHWSSGDSKVELLVRKPLGLWTAEEVAMWMESLGSWSSPYRDSFRKEQVNGRYNTNMLLDVCISREERGTN